MKEATWHFVVRNLAKEAIRIDRSVKIAMGTEWISFVAGWMTRSALRGAYRDLVDFMSSRSVVCSCCYGGRMAARFTPVGRSTPTYDDFEKEGRGVRQQIWRSMGGLVDAGDGPEQACDAMRATCAGAAAPVACLVALLVVLSALMPRRLGPAWEKALTAAACALAANASYNLCVFAREAVPLSRSLEWVPVGTFGFLVVLVAFRSMCSDRLAALAKQVEALHALVEQVAWVCGLHQQIRCWGAPANLATPPLKGMGASSIAGTRARELGRGN